MPATSGRVTTTRARKRKPLKALDPSPAIREIEEQQLDYRRDFTAFLQLQRLYWAKPQKRTKWNASGWQAHSTSAGQLPQSIRPRDGALLSQGWWIVATSQPTGADRQDRVRVFYAVCSARNQTSTALQYADICVPSPIYVENAPPSLHATGRLVNDMYSPRGNGVVQGKLYAFERSSLAENDMDRFEQYDLSYDLLTPRTFRLWCLLPGMRVRCARPDFGGQHLTPESFVPYEEEAEDTEARQGGGRDVDWLGKMRLDCSLVVIEEFNERMVVCVFHSHNKRIQVLVSGEPEDDVSIPERTVREAYSEARDQRADDMRNDPDCYDIGVPSEAFFTYPNAVEVDVEILHNPLKTLQDSFSDSSSPRLILIQSRREILSQLRPYLQAMPWLHRLPSSSSREPPHNPLIFQKQAVYRFMGHVVGLRDWLYQRAQMATAAGIPLCNLDVKNPVIQAWDVIYGRELIRRKCLVRYGVGSRGLRVGRHGSIGHFSANSRGHYHLPCVEFEMTNLVLNAVVNAPFLLTERDAIGNYEYSLSSPGFMALRTALKVVLGRAALDDGYLALKDGFCRWLTSSNAQLNDSELASYILHHLSSYSFRALTAEIAEISKNSGPSVIHGTYGRLVMAVGQGEEDGFDFARRIPSEIRRKRQFELLELFPRKVLDGCVWWDAGNWAGIIVWDEDDGDQSFERAKGQLQGLKDEIGTENAENQALDNAEARVSQPLNQTESPSEERPASAPLTMVPSSEGPSAPPRKTPRTCAYVALQPRVYEVWRMTGGLELYLRHQFSFLISLYLMETYLHRHKWALRDTPRMQAMVWGGLKSKVFEGTKLQPVEFRSRFLRTSITTYVLKRVTESANLEDPRNIEFVKLLAAVLSVDSDLKENAVGPLKSQALRRMGVTEWSKEAEYRDPIEIILPYIQCRECDDVLTINLGYGDWTCRTCSAPLPIDARLLELVRDWGSNIEDTAKVCLQTGCGRVNRHRFSENCEACGGEIGYPDTRGADQVGGTSKYSSDIEAREREKLRWLLDLARGENGRNAMPRTLKFLETLLEFDVPNV